MTSYQKISVLLLRRSSQIAFTTSYWRCQRAKLEPDNTCFSCYRRFWDLAKLILQNVFAVHLAELQISKENIMIFRREFEESPNQVHVWCYTDTFSSLLSGTTKIVTATASLFGLINYVAVFIRDSYQKVKTWQNVSQDFRHRRVSIIGENRWWSKHAAPRIAFGGFPNADISLYPDFVVTVSGIQETARA
jgi:hypothetical protein